MDHEPYPADVIWIILFDVLTAVSLLWLLRLSQTSGSSSPPGDYDFYYRLVSNVTHLLFLVTPIFLLTATFLLLRRPLQNRRRAAFCQRFAFWGLLLLVAVNFLSGYLPTEGGVGGFLLITFLASFSILAVVAFGCAQLVTGWSRQERSKEENLS